MIRWLVALFGRRSFPLRDYGPWQFGEHVTVYVGRRWSWRGVKRSWTSRGVRHVWYDQMPARVYCSWSKKRRCLMVVKIEVGTLLVCWDRHAPEYAAQWVGDDAVVERPEWWGWRRTT